MPWPFPKKARPVEPPSPPGGNADAPPAGPDREAPRGGPWQPAAPEEWPDPADASELDRLARAQAELERAARGTAGWPGCGLAGRANVFPRIGSRRRDLVALGESLAVWKGRHAGDVVVIHGLNHLLAGEYPPMEVYIGCVNSQTRDAPGWETCPAGVVAEGRLFEPRDLMSSLMDELPEGCYGRIGGVLPD